MTTHVLDTSVAVAWYVNESFSSAARQWQTRALRGDVSLCVPNLHFWEFANVLRTYVRRGELDADLAAETYDLHLDAPLTVIEPDRRQTFLRALELGATVYDAVYIELSISLDIPFVTAEKTTTPWVKKLGDRARLVR